MKMKFIHPPFFCEPQMQSHIEKLFDGEYDVPLFGHGLTILDIGANVGSFAIWASHRWPGSLIHCFEPHPKTFELLKKNLASYPRIGYFDWGIGTPGMRPLYDGINNCGEATLYRNAVTSEVGQHVEIKSPLTLPKADILKIDTEGCEIEILQPLIRDGRRYKAVMFEYHNKDNRRIADLLLKDYTLVSNQINGNPHLGVSCYLHNSIEVVIE